MIVHIEKPDEVGPLEVVLDKADDATAPLVPPVAVAWTLTVVHLGIQRAHLQDNLVLPS